MGSLRSISVGKRAGFIGLLSLADDAVGHVEAHLDDGALLSWLDSDTGAVVGAVQAVPRTLSVWELVLVAVEADQQGRGHGSAMVGVAVEWLASRGARRVIVGTATAGPRQLAFYQRLGFRAFAVERDHFDQGRGYDGTETENGIAIRDMVWLDRLIP